MRQGWLAGELPGRHGRQPAADPARISSSWTACSSRWRSRSARDSRSLGNRRPRVEPAGLPSAGVATACAAPSGRCRRRSARTARAGAASGLARGRRSGARRPPCARTAGRRWRGPPRRRARTRPASTAASPPCGRGPRAVPTRPPVRAELLGERPRLPGGDARREGGERGRDADEATSGGIGVGSRHRRSLARRLTARRPRASMVRQSTIRPARRPRVACTRTAPRPPAAPAAEHLHDRHRRDARRRGPDRHALRQPGRRARQPGRLRRGRGLPAARRHRPRRVLGRQRPPGVRLLPRAVGLHAGRLRGLETGVRDRASYVMRQHDIRSS